MILEHEEIFVTMSNDSLHLRMILIAGDQNEVPFLRFLRCDLVDARNERTGRINDWISELFNGFVDIPADPVGTA